ACRNEDHLDRVLLKDGRTIELLCRSVAYGSLDKSWVIIFRDISSTFEVEKMLYAALQELGAIIDASRRGVVLVKKGKITRASSKAEQMLGYEKKEMEGMNAQSLFSQDKDEASLSTGSVESLPDGVFMSERMFLRKNSSKFWATLTGRALDHKAPAAGAVWVIEDITEQKRSDEKIRMSNTVFDNINEGIIISDIKGVIQFVNPAFTRVTGYAPEEAIGKRPSILQSGRHDKDFYHDMWQRLVDAGGWQGEIWNRRKSGEIYAEWLSITAMKGAHGETTHYTGVFSDITYKKDNDDLVHHLAFHDPLTHLPNRRMFFERMDVELAHAKREGSQVAVLFMDLDNFKQINDVLGHNAGDMVLQMTGDRISGALRESDSVSRFGGDEFTILVPKLRGNEDAGDIAGKILDSLTSTELTVGTDTVRVQASLGISVYPDDGLTGEDLINKADRAMYFAKKEEKGTFKFFDHTTML
ncbi:MAG: diguanylate cyclase, partial [Nitrospinota bacterium]|nr:diguanylate cyclase [Nitrospinota bacterium]